MKEIKVKKPQQKRSKAKFLAVLKVFPRVLADYGYAKTTTARLALEADISIASLYDYFSCKEAVFMAYIDHELTRVLQDVADKAVVSNSSPESTLSCLLDSGLAFAYQQRPILQLMAAELPTIWRHIDLSDSRQQINQIALSFSEQHSLHVKNDDVQLMVCCLTNIMLGFQLRIIFLPDEGFGREEIFKELKIIVGRYLGVTL